MTKLWQSSFKTIYAQKPRRGVIINFYSVHIIIDGQK